MALPSAPWHAYPPDPHGFVEPPFTTTFSNTSCCIGLAWAPMITPGDSFGSLIVMSLSLMFFHVTLSEIGHFADGALCGQAREQTWLLSACCAGPIHTAHCSGLLMVMFS